MISDLTDNTYPDKGLQLFLRCQHGLTLNNHNGLERAPLQSPSTFFLYNSSQALLPCLGLRNSLLRFPHEWSFYTNCRYDLEFLWFSLNIRTFLYNNRSSRC